MGSKGRRKSKKTWLFFIALLTYCYYPFTYSKTTSQAQAIEKKAALQDIDTAALTAKLRSLRAIMEWKSNPGIQEKF
ncbi:MAG: hypothetical protein J2P21_21705 [Chloracidobacterium sp.]|nr:hypothetical protein [Chloracidobacterium sp.]